MSQPRQGLLWIGAGVLAVVVSQLLFAIGSLLGIVLLPIGCLCALYGSFLLVSARGNQERWSDPLGWSIVAAMLTGAGVFAWILRDWTILLFSAVVVSLVVVARRRRSRLAREWQQHVASQRPAEGSDGHPDS